MSFSFFQPYCAQHGSECMFLWLWQIEQECQASIEEDGETLVIDGYRFESVTSREGLRRLSSQAVAGGLQGDTWLMATLVVSSQRVNKVKRLAEVTVADRQTDRQKITCWVRRTNGVCNSLWQRDKAVPHHVMQMRNVYVRDLDFFC